jgi:hypothetical protein
LARFWDLCLGWLFSENRRQLPGTLVQAELRLRATRPVRNDLFEDDAEVVERRRSRVVWESAPVGATNGPFDTENVWRRLRGRGPVAERVLRD